jgi:D-alanyl-D-alanine carboxypeptidase
MFPCSAYPTTPVGVPRNNARERGWGRGWPECQRGRLAAVTAGELTVYLRREIAPLVATLLEATERRYAYPIRAGQTWGYAHRAIQGTDVPSNHSWGLAVDINAGTNPMARAFRSDLPPAVVAMWWAAGFYWGGWYTRRPSTMHFEYVRRPGDVATDLDTALAYLGGERHRSGRHLRLAEPPRRSPEAARMSSHAWEFGDGGGGRVAHVAMAG